MNKLRHIATSYNGSVFLTAEFEKKVYAWDLDTFKLISEFETVLDSGGKRLAVSEDGKHCIAAAYERYGVAMYDILNGSKVWQRKDIKKTQYVDFNPQNDKIYLGVEDTPMAVLYRNDGSEIEKLRAVTKIYFEPITSKPIMIKGRNTLVDGKVKITSPTFAFLDIKPISKGICMSAVSNDLMFYNYEKQKITWRIAPKEGEHFIKLGYSDKNDLIYAILFKYTESRNPPHFLLYGILPTNGEVSFIFPLPSTNDYGFMHEASKLICSNGEVYELSVDEPKLIFNFNWE